MSAPGRIAGEPRSPIRMALYAGGASLLLICAYIGWFVTRPTSGAAPTPVAGPAEKRLADPVVVLAMTGVKDGVDFDADPGYGDAFRCLKARPGAAGGGSPLAYDEVVKSPADHRGEPVRMSGLVLDLKAVRLPDPINGEQDVFRGFVAGTDGERAIAFDLIAPPDIVVEKFRDMLDVEGVFYRTVSYEAVDPRTKPPTTVQRQIPYLLATSIRHVGRVAPPPPWHGLSPVATAVLGLSGGLAIVFIVRARSRARVMAQSAKTLHQMLRTRSIARAARSNPPRPSEN